MRLYGHPSPCHLHTCAACFTSALSAYSVASPKQVTNVKVALTDDKFTYEPSYNLVRKAPSLSISRPLHGGKYKFGWNLKTDDLSLEYSYKYIRLLALKSPNQPVPRLAASLEHDFEVGVVGVVWVGVWLPVCMLCLRAGIMPWALVRCRGRSPSRAVLQCILPHQDTVLM